MKAILLAAGSGTRLRPHTDDKPKCLVPLAGRTLLERQLASLKAAGVTEIAVVGGYRAEMLRAAGLRVIVNERWETTNMVESLLCAAAEFGGAETLVCYADIVYEPRLIAALRKAPGDLSVLVDDAWRRLWEIRFADPLSDAETLKVGPGGRLLEIGGKPRSLADIESQYIGLLKFTPGAFAAAAALCAKARGGAGLGGRTVEKAFMTDLIQGLIDEGRDVRAERVSGGWLEVDSTTDLERYERMKADGTLSGLCEAAA